MNRHSIVNYIYNYDYFYKNANLNYREIIQTGGNSITMKYKDDIFNFDVNKDNTFFYLRTLSGHNDCITLGVDKINKTVNINNINGDSVEPCFQTVTNKKGTFLLEIAIKFAKKLKNENIIDVNRITLTDHSIKHCIDTKTKKVIFSDLRQIISGDTFYGKHRFIPIDEENKENYKKNKKKLSKLFLKDVKLEEYINEYNSDGKKMTQKSFETMISFVKKNQHMKISQYFDILSDVDSFESNCDLINYLIKRIYRKFKLESMFDVTYEMKL